MLERCQLSILRVILGLPDRVSTIAIHHLAWTLPFKLLVYKADFSHYLMMLSPNLYFCGDMPNIPQKGSAIKSLTDVLEELDLPQPVDPLISLPSKTGLECPH